MKVSFDFDSTLSRKDVQRFAKELVIEGHEVWIVTSRVSDEMANNYPVEFKNRVLRANRKLFRVADNVGIKRGHIIFTGFVKKIEFIKGKGFAFHLDDDSDELIEILQDTDPCKPINVEHFEWETDCRKKLNLKQ
jgi:hypothetical protein